MAAVRDPSRQISFCLDDKAGADDPAQTPQRGKSEQRGGVA